MRFDRYPKLPERKPSPQRIAAARAAIRRERDAVPLFPELVRPQFASVEVRIATNEEAARAAIQDMRDFNAASWRKARRELRSLRPLQRAGLMTWWNRGITPGNPSYLLGAIRDCHRGVCYWRKLAYYRRLRLYATGKLSVIPKPE